MGELPTDFVVGRLWTVRIRESDGFDGISGGAQCMRSHMADGHRLTGGSGSGQCGRRFDLTRRYATFESAADFLGSVQLSPGERAGTGDGRAGPFITWSFGLKQSKNPLCAVGGPGGHKTAVSFAQRLRRSRHRCSLRNATANSSEFGGE